MNSSYTPSTYVPAQFPCIFILLVIQNGKLHLVLKSKINANTYINCFFFIFNYTHLMWKWCKIARTIELKGVREKKTGWRTHYFMQSKRKNVKTDLQRNKSTYTASQLNQPSSMRNRLNRWNMSNGFKFLFTSIRARCNYQPDENATKWISLDYYSDDDDDDTHDFRKLWEVLQYDWIRVLAHAHLCSVCMWFYIIFISSNLWNCSH